jgi:hypothetical protein
MGFHTVGRVVDKWCAVPVPVFDGWGLPPPSASEEIPHYYLRVAVLDPQTEETSEWRVECGNEAQWERYFIGNWLRLWVQRWPHFLPVFRMVTIVE